MFERLKITINHLSVARNMLAEGASLAEAAAAVGWTTSELDLALWAAIHRPNICLGIARLSHVDSLNLKISSGQ